MAFGVVGSFRSEKLATQIAHFAVGIAALSRLSCTLSEISVFWMIKSRDVPKLELRVGRKQPLVISRPSESLLPPSLAYQINTGPQII